MPQEYVDTTLLDGYAGGPHITVEQVGLANQGVYGAEDYVLGVGKRAEAQVLTNNSIRIFDAVYVIQGRRDVINANGYKDVSIANGAQGMKRNDIIVRRYEKDESSEIEKTSYAVIKGTPSAGVAVDPEVTTGDIKSGATLHEMALYRVKIEGLNIVSVEPLFNVLLNMYEINTYLSHKVDIVKLTTSKETFTGEYYGGKPVYAKIIDIETMPDNTSKTISTGIKDADYFWIDSSNSMARNGGASYPIPYVDPAQPASGIAARLYNGGETLAVWTKTNWSGYSAFVTVKYTKK